jgi:hypothetical protein
MSAAACSMDAGTFLGCPFGASTRTTLDDV